MKTALFSLVALTFPCANAFTVAPALRTVRPSSNARAKSCVMMAEGLKEEDFVPSERWLGEYMGQQGLRYALNKTPKEIEKEGDYSIFEKLFGQTSNNEARMKLKEQILKKVNIPTDPELYKSWTAKYGYGRFFPAYVDKSGSSNDEVVAAAPQAEARAAPEPKKASGPGLGGLFASRPSAPKVAVAAKPKVVAAAKPRVVAAKPKVTAPKVTAQPKPAASRVKPAPTPVAPKPKGNIKNLPKAL